VTNKPSTATKQQQAAATNRQTMRDKQAFYRDKTTTSSSKQTDKLHKFEQHSTSPLALKCASCKLN